MSTPPIILFYFDQLRYDATGPNLERLAKDAIRFETCITNAPLCRPARITMMTGRPVHEHGFDTNHHVPDPDAVESHVRRLRDEAGYHTVVVGKTHLHDGADHLDENRPLLERWGFADACELPDPQQHFIRSAHSDWLGPDKYRRWRDYAAHFRHDAPPPEAAPWHLSSEDHLDSFCARAAAERIRSYAGDRPLYLQVNFPGPHPPFDPPAERLPITEPPPPISSKSTGPVPPVFDRQRRRQPSLTFESLAHLRRRYFGKVALVDYALGVVLDALDEAGLSDEAWIALTSDHGELCGDHGFFGKVLPYEASIRVPLLLRPPGGLPAITDSSAVDHIDLVKTLMAIGGVESDVDLRNGTSRNRAIVFENMGCVGVRTDAETMLWDRSLGRPVLLFDRQCDPEEHHNVVDEADYRTRVHALREGHLDSVLSP